MSQNAEIALAAKAVASVVVVAKKLKKDKRGANKNTKRLRTTANES